MKQILTTITKGGQITLPAEIQKKLGVHPHDKVAIVIDDNDEIRIIRPKYTLASLKGILPATRTEDFDDMIRNAQEDMIRNGYGEIE